MFKLKASLGDKIQAALLGLQTAERYCTDTDPISQSILAYGNALLNHPTRTLSPPQHFLPEPVKSEPETLDGTCQQIIRWVPFLLRWHDQARIRHQHIEAAPLSDDAQAMLWIFGHLLEYLLSATVKPQHLHQSTHQYLIRQLHSEFGPIDQAILQTALDQIWATPPQPPSPLSVIGTRVDLDRSFMTAIRQFVTLPESYVLAMNNAGQTQSMQTQSIVPAMITGFMTGAWGGLSVVPVQWIKQLSDHGTQMTRLSQTLYADWAGIADPLQFRTASTHAQVMSAQAISMSGLPLER